MRDLYVSFRRRGNDLPVLRGVTLNIGAGEAYGLVGESGCGKTTLALAVVRYLARNGVVHGGSISVQGQDVLGLDRESLRGIEASASPWSTRTPPDRPRPINASW